MAETTQLERALDALALLRNQAQRKHDGVLDDAWAVRLAVRRLRGPRRIPNPTTHESRRH